MFLQDKAGAVLKSFNYVNADRGAEAIEEKCEASRTVGSGSLGEKSYLHCIVVQRDAASADVEASCPEDAAKIITEDGYT